MMLFIYHTSSQVDSLTTCSRKHPHGRLETQFHGGICFPCFETWRHILHIAIRDRILYTIWRSSVAQCEGAWQA